MLAEQHEVKFFRQMVMAVCVVGLQVCAKVENPFKMLYAGLG